jgi:preprotein translocase subunit SecY
MDVDYHELKSGPFFIHDLSLGLWQEKHDGATSGAETAYSYRVLVGFLLPIFIYIVFCVVFCFFFCSVSF